MKTISAIAALLILALGADTAMAAMGAPPSRSSIAPFIGNKGNRKVHRTSCIWGQKISPGKTIYFNSYQEAKDAGYIPCKTCRPELSEAAATALSAPPQIMDTDICASRTKQFFHRGSCPWAHKITAEHLIKYKTREEAIADGKLPCQVCKP